MGLYEKPNPNSEKQHSLESPSFLAAAQNAVRHGIDGLKMGGNLRTGLPVDACEGVQYPIRPSEPDCAFYLRTGCCKFGSCCRFNHPREKRVVQIFKERDKGIPKVVNQCKFYSMPGGCKFGEACSYSHSHEVSESVPVELNSLGLPVRKGERLCLYYMRTGICKYNSSCKFHHPELSGITGLHFLGSHSVAFLQSTSMYSHLSVSSQTLQTTSNDSGSNFEVFQPYMPAISLERLNPYKDQIRCEDSSLPSLSERTNCHSSAADQNEFSKLVDSPMQQKEVIDNHKESCESQPQNGIRCEDFRLDSPRRPNHFEGRLSEPEGCFLSPTGLPQRPDHPVCIYYSRFGICKYGPACKFDHPVDENTEQSMTRFTEQKMEDEPNQS